MWELCGSVFHQGTRYPASAAIVPFLVALVANPAIYDCDKIIDFAILLSDTIMPAFAAEWILSLSVTLEEASRC
jgi:hypothetical protein